MALVISGKTVCHLCGRVLEDGDDIRCFPPLPATEDRLARFSDCAVHTSCFAACDERDDLDALLARSEAPSGAALAELELNLLAEIETHRDATATAGRWREIHRTYAGRAAADDEALKRALFIQWYAEAEVKYVTGLGELDPETVNDVVQRVSARFARPDPQGFEAELRHMVAWYRGEYDVPVADIVDHESPGDLDTPPCHVIETTEGRGVMGVYWSRFCGRVDSIRITNSPENMARAFRRAQMILRGEREAPRGDGGAHKGLALVLPMGDTSRMDATAVEVRARHGGDPRRTMMFVEDLPAALGDLMKRAGLTAVRDSVVCRLPGGRFYSGPQPDRTMWILPQSDRITIYFANASERPPPPQPISPIDEQRFPVPELEAAAPWKALRPVFIDRPGRCPHCSTVTIRWRELTSKWLVCSACDRSLAPDDLRSAPRE